jgi:nitrogen fixation protein
MKIHSVSMIHHPREAVFQAYRDRLSEIAAYIPDVREIAVQTRKEDGGIIELHNVWKAQREVPTALKMVLKPENLEWDDYARWDEAAFICDWEIKTRVFREKVSCKGRNTFTVEGGKTKVLLSGDLDIDMAKVPGVPRLLARKLGPQVEKFIVSLITPNLEQVNKSLERFLDDQG